MLKKNTAARRKAKLHDFAKKAGVKLEKKATAQPATAKKPAAKATAKKAAAKTTAPKAKAE